MWLPIVGLSIIGVGFSSARSRRKKMLGFLMVAIVMGALLLMPGCGGSNGGGGGSGSCTGCTSAGNYTITITGAGTDTSSTMHSTTVTLAVN
jgi:ABC-type glycerol-3-phosphate transport system substrate-binding protein